MPDNAIGTSNIWPYYAKQNVAKAANKQDETMGKDDFLKILVAQLRHQDPMQPMQDREFIAQMAQFSAVEQMMNMAEEMNALRQSIGISPDLIGKSIRWIQYYSDGTIREEMTGVVEAITFKDGMQYVVVGDYEITLDQIVRVWQAEESS